MFIKTLAEFACNLRFSDTSMEAIRLIRQCARVVSERSTQFAREESTGATKASGEAASDVLQLRQQELEGAGEKKQNKTASEMEADGDDKKEEGEDEEGEEALWRRGWMPILYELFRVINK